MYLPLLGAPCLETPGSRRVPGSLNLRRVRVLLQSVPETVVLFSFREKYRQTHYKKKRSQSTHTIDCARNARSTHVAPGHPLYIAAPSHHESRRCRSVVGDACGGSFATTSKYTSVALVRRDSGNTSPRPHETLAQAFHSCCCEPFFSGLLLIYVRSIPGKLNLTPDLTNPVGCIG